MDRQAARDVNIVGPVNDEGQLIAATALAELIEAGKAYFLARNDLNIADDGLVEYLIQTPAFDIALVGEVTASADATIDLFEAPTFSPAGAAQTLFNANRNSSNTSSATVTKGPTLTDDGTLLTDNFINGGQKNQAFGGGTSSAFPLILKQSSSYLLRIKNISGSNAAINVGLGVLELN